MPEQIKTEEDRKYDEFVRDIAKVINKHSWERFSNTPDYILAEYMAGCLTVFENTIQNRATHSNGGTRPQTSYEE